MNLKISTGRSFLKKDDVLFKSKSNHPVSAVIPKELNNTIASHHFFILDILDNNINPYYLSWLLNQKPAQRYFREHGGRTVAFTINKKTLGELEINIPDMKMQEKIIRIHKLRLKELELEQKLIEKRKQVLDAILTKTINDENIQRRE